MHLPKETTTMNIESLVTDGWTTDRVACENVADILFKSDLVEHCEVIFCGHNDHFEKEYCIQIYDEWGCLERQVRPRRLSRSDATKRREEKRRGDQIARRLTGG